MDDNVRCDCACFDDTAWQFEGSNERQYLTGGCRLTRDCFGASLALFFGALGVFIGATASATVRTPRSTAIAEILMKVSDPNDGIAVMEVPVVLKCGVNCTSAAFSFKMGSPCHALWTIGSKMFTHVLHVPAIDGRGIGIGHHHHGHGTTHLVETSL